MNRPKLRPMKGQNYGTSAGAGGREFSEFLKISCA